MKRRFFLSPEPPASGHPEPGVPPTTEPPKAETTEEPPKVETPKADATDDEREPKWFKPYRKTLRRIESDFLTQRGREATAEPLTEPVTVVVQEKETPEPQEPEKNEKPETPPAPPKPMGGTMLRRNRSVR